jgi:hypothetical protein
MPFATSSKSNPAPLTESRPDTSSDSEMLTPSEIALLRRESKETSAYVREQLRQSGAPKPATISPGKPSTTRTTR